MLPENIENPWFSNVFYGYRNETLIWNGLKKSDNITQMIQNLESKEERPSFVSIRHFS